MKDIFSIVWRLLLGVALVFAIHLLVLHFLNQPIWANKIILSYVVNTVLTIGILNGLLRAIKTHNTSIGFLFLGGSMLKFALFFIFFLPGYKEDGAMDKYEFSTFFVPYAANLFLETKALINKLSKDE